jgi:hypothetical protein
VWDCNTRFFPADYCSFILSDGSAINFAHISESKKASPNSLDEGAVQLLEAAALYSFWRQLLEHQPSRASNLHY